MPVHGSSLNVSSTVAVPSTEPITSANTFAIRSSVGVRGAVTVRLVDHGDGKIAEAWEFLDTAYVFECMTPPNR